MRNRKRRHALYLPIVQVPIPRTFIWIIHTKHHFLRHSSRQYMSYIKKEC
ncbi:hypothetical protein M2369_002461 [Bacillus sp. JUb11]|nr:hypothetical protein [Bacillus sp. JUb11]